MSRCTAATTTIFGWVNLTTTQVGIDHTYHVVSTTSTIGITRNLVYALAKYREYSAVRWWLAIAAIGAVDFDDLGKGATQTISVASHQVYTLAKLRKLFAVFWLGREVAIG